MNGTMKSIAADNGSSGNPNACHALPDGQPIPEHPERMLAEAFKAE